MTSHKASLSGTHISNFKGRFRVLAGPPVKDAPGGIRDGDMYFDSRTNTYMIYDGADSKWYGSPTIGTTTSTSTTTTSTSTSTTTTSTSTSSSTSTTTSSSTTTTSTSSSTTTTSTSSSTTTTSTSTTTTSTSTSTTTTV